MTGWTSSARIAASAAGSKRYDAGFRCVHGHEPLRYVSTGGCVACKRLAKAERRLGPGDRARLARASAQARGLLTYIGKPCKHGHDGKRWVSSSTCVECASLAYRAARPIRVPEKKLKLEKKVRVLAATVPRRLGATKLRIKRILTDKQLERRRAKCREYKARKRAATGRHTQADIVWLRAKQGGRCAVCLTKIGKGVAWEVDHRVALRCGGTDDRSNLQITHRSCNRSKGTHDEIAYVQSRLGRLL